jgi:predicted transcriptional regulator
MATNEYELGEAVEVDRRARAGVVVSVRLSQDEVTQLQEFARRRGATLSQVARDAITGFIENGGKPRWYAVQWTGTMADANNLVLTQVQQSSIVVTRGEVRTGNPKRAEAKTGT